MRHLKVGHRLKVVVTNGARATPRAMHTRNAKGNAHVLRIVNLPVMRAVRLEQEALADDA
jgi:hypothetical protein